LTEPSEIVVIKFGGSVLADQASIAKAASFVKEERSMGLGVVVVVSALKGVTDSLLSLSKMLNPDAPADLLDEVLSEGERQSARLFAASLAAYGIEAEVVDPSSSFWPIITDDLHQDANPILEETRKMTINLILPMIRKGAVPVICGFLGRTEDGHVTTLGRGGSDTTAVLMGSCLEAKEVVLVKDVDGVFSSDPAKVGNPQIIESLDREEADLLARGGAKFLHSKALRYQAPGMAIRVTGLDKLKSGTVIRGERRDLHVELLPLRVSMLTVVGWETKADSIVALHSAVSGAGGTLLALSLEPKSALLYVGDGEGSLKAVHDLVVERRIGKAVSCFDGLSMIAVKGGDLETTPGLIQQVAKPLAEARINIYGIVTISSSIRVFVMGAEAVKAARMIEVALRVNGS